MLEHNYDVGSDELPQQLADVAAKLAEEYWAEHRQDILYIVDGSFLEEYDEYNIEVQFKSAATVSITYALMSRCGLEPEQYLSHEDFMPIFDFNTPAIIGALGTAVSQVNQQVLRQIEATVKQLLPFRSLAITGLVDRPGTYVTILAKEDRSKELRQRRPSVRRQLTQEPRRAEKAEGKAPVRKKKEPQR